MKRLGALLWLFSALTASGGTLRAGPTSALSAPPGFSTYKLLHVRNIFDPDRRPPVTGTAAVSAPAMVPSDYAVLTGTLISRDKTLAFFSGSRADFNRVLPLHEKIADETIAQIDPGSVTLERSGKRQIVAVGWTLPLNGSPSAPAPDAATAPVAPVAPAAPATTNAPTTPAAPGAILPNPPPGAVAAGAPAAKVPPPAATPDENVARMMRERRQHEMQ